MGAGDPVLKICPVVLLLVASLAGASAVAQAPGPRPGAMSVSPVGPPGTRPPAPPQTAEPVRDAENVSPIIHAELPIESIHEAEAPTPAGDRSGAWGYDGPTGPEHWAELSPEYARCGSGESQSPIDIRRAYTGRMVHSRYRPGSLHYEPLERLRFIYYPGPLHILRTNHNIQVEDESGSYFRVGRHKFDLERILFHAPSEHRVAGHVYPMEIQLTHRHNDVLAGVAVFVTEGTRNRALERFLNVVPKQFGEESDYRVLKQAARDLLPHDKGYYHYSGSLTSPPCSEGVSWYVMKQPIGASRKQIERFRALLGNNSRPVQPVNDRDVFQTAPGHGD